MSFYFLLKQLIKISFCAFLVFKISYKVQQTAALKNIMEAMATSIVELLNN